MGIPFRCYRCHVYGHLANDCSLPFIQKPVSVKKIWRVKKSETNLMAKKGKLHEECSKDLNLSPYLDDKDLGSHSSLTNLKPLCINNLVEDLGGLKIDKVSALVSSFEPDQKEALRDLGFVSPPKALSGVHKGYFLRYVSKSIIDGLGPGCDPFEVK